VQLGSGAMTNSIAELGNADVVFVTGANPHSAHPVIGTFLTRAKENGTKIISCDPRRTISSELSDVHLQHYSGGDIAVINGMINHIINSNLHDKKFIEERTKNFDAMWDVVKEYTPEKSAELAGVSADDIRKAAELYAKGPKSTIVFGMGVAQHANAVDAVWAIANLAMITGMVGKESTGINPLRGQNNVQGVCDMAGLPHFLPGYQLFDEDFVKLVVGADILRDEGPEKAEAAAAGARATREKFEKAWGVSLNPKHGLTELEMTNKALEGAMKCMYVVGANPVIANPDSGNVIKALKNLDFLVVHDIFMTETAELADVVLPATSFAEKWGTVTNTERRIQLLRPAIDPIGQSKPDYQILIELMSLFGYENNMTTAEDVMKEIASLAPQYAGVTYDKIVRNDDRFVGVRWPIAADAEKGLNFLHGAGFPVGTAKLMPVKYSPPKEETSAEYPIILTTGRDLYHFHTTAMSGKTEGIVSINPYGVLEINPEDAKIYNFSEGDKIKISSARGTVTAKAHITENIKKGVVFSSFHHADTHINMITNPAMDPIAAEPELKVCAVKLERV
jgi:formate dehydrogenase major subunit